MIKTYEGQRVLQELPYHWLSLQDDKDSMKFYYRIIEGTLYKAYYRHNTWNMDKAHVYFNYFLSGVFEESDDIVKIGDRFLREGDKLISLKEVSLTEMLSSEGFIYGEGERIDNLKQHNTALQDGRFYLDDLLVTLGEFYTSGACKKTLLETKWFVEVK